MVCDAYIPSPSLEICIFNSAFVIHLAVVANYVFFDDVIK